MIEAQEKFSVEDLKCLKYNTRLLLAERVKPALLEALAAQVPRSDDLAEARRVLEARDGRASASSRDQIRIFAARDLRPVWPIEADVAAHTGREYRTR